jgi:Ca2+-binding EF-hand superfamily protein
LEKLGIVLSTNEADYILKDVRKHNYGKFECTYKNLVDFMTKNRINVAFVEKGFIDPLLANTVQALNRVKDVHDFTYEHLFRILDAEEKKHFSKEQFMICLQGMDLGCAVEDIIELFNYMDDQNINRVS